MSGATPFITAVLGVDGSGKSTLARRLALECSASHKTCVISDRAEIFERGQATDLHAQLTEHLRRRIAARAKQAGSLDQYKIPKIAELVLRDRLLGEIIPEYRLSSLFMDGMPILNLVAWTILYQKLPLTSGTCLGIISALTQRGPRRPADDPVYTRFPELSRLRDLGFDHLHLPDATVFLDVPPAVCMERIDSRGKDKQVHETEAALLRLRDAYLVVCETLAQSLNLPVLVLEGDRAPDAIASEARAFVEQAWRTRDAG